MKIYVITHKAFKDFAPRSLYVSLLVGADINKGKNFYLKLEIKQEDIDKLRNSIYDFLKKGEIDPEKLQQHLKCLIIAEVVLWGGFIVYLFISKGY